jgi:multidrug efflux pump subunit AcrB
VPTLVLWLYRGRDDVIHGSKPRRRAAWLRPFAAAQAAFERGFARLRDGYRRWLAAVLDHRIAFSAAFVAFLAASTLLVPRLGQDFFPAVDAGQLRLHLRARSGTRIEETARLTDQVEDAIRHEIPPHEVAGVLDNIGIPSGGIPLTYIDNGLVGTGDADILVSLRAGHAPTADYVRRLRLRLAREFPGTTFYFLPADIVSQTINFGLSAPLDIQIVGRDRKQSQATAGRLADELRRIVGVVDVRVQQPVDLPQLQIAVDRSRASEVGMTERDVANSVQLGLSGSGQVQPSYWLNRATGVQYLVNVRVPQAAMDSLEALRAIPAAPAGRPGDGQLLANVATIRRGAVAPIASHYNVMPVIDVLAGVSGRDLGGVLRDIEPAVARAEKELPRGSFIVLRGQAETMRSSYRGLGVGLLVAVVLVYLLLVVNFQSWLDPLVIVSALPAALAGVVWGLFLSFSAISVPALMGAIMSLGVATSNSILVVTFARGNLREGMDPRTAALEAGVGRLRPVLMTALAMIIGMVPLALGLGEGGEQNAPLGRAVVGGLIVATLATLFFVPVVFRHVHRPVTPTTAPADDVALTASHSTTAMEDLGA